MTREAGEAVLFALLSGYGAMLFTWWLVLRWKWHVFVEEARAIELEGFERGRATAIQDMTAERTRIQEDARARVREASERAADAEADREEVKRVLGVERVYHAETTKHRDDILRELAVFSRECADARLTVKALRDKVAWLERDRETRRRGWRCPTHGWLFAESACCIRGDDGTNSPHWPLATHRECEKHGAHERAAPPCDAEAEAHRAAYVEATPGAARCGVEWMGFGCDKRAGHSGQHTAPSPSTGGRNWWGSA